MSVGTLALLDKLAATLDDIVIATKKTTGIIGDDLAVSAEGFVQATANREVPMVMAVMKRSFVNKIIIIPMILLLSYFLPWLITPILFCGGLFLSYEAVEKVHEYFHPHSENQDELTGQTMAEFEENKIKEMGTIDFVLSLEICLIALNSVQTADMQTQAIVLVTVGILATLFIYGVSLAIVRSDDLGMYLIKNSPYVKLGRFLVGLMPKMIKVLSIVGLVAMAIVGGEIVTHSIAHYWHAAEDALAFSVDNAFLNFLSHAFVSIVSAGIAGVVVMSITSISKRYWIGSKS